MTCVDSLITWGWPVDSLVMTPGDQYYIEGLHPTRRPENIKIGFDQKQGEDIDLGEIPAIISERWAALTTHKGGVATALDNQIADTMRVKEEIYQVKDRMDLEKFDRMNASIKAPPLPQENPNI